MIARPSPSSVPTIIAMSAQEFLDHYKNKIIKYEDNPDVLTRSLQKLDQVRVTIDLLAVGCIGIVA